MMGRSGLVGDKNVPRPYLEYRYSQILRRYIHKLQNIFIKKVCIYLCISIIFCNFALDFFRVYLSKRNSSTLLRIEYF